MYEHFCKAWDSFKHYLLNKKLNMLHGGIVVHNDLEKF